VQAMPSYSYTTLVDDTRCSALLALLLFSTIGILNKEARKWEDHPFELYLNSPRMASVSPLLSMTWHLSISTPDSS